MHVAKSAGSSVWRLLVAGFVVLPAAVRASVDGDLGEASIGYGDLGVDASADPIPLLPGATLPGATSPGAADTSGCSSLGDACCKDSSVNFEPFCDASHACDLSTKTCTKCNKEGDPCCFDPDSSKETCSNTLTLACDLGSDLTFSCVKCDTVGNLCCKDSGKSFCTDFLACDKSANRCAEQQDFSVPCNTVVKSNGLVLETKAVWDMVATQGSAAKTYEVFYDVGTTATVDLSIIKSDGTEVPTYYSNGDKADTVKLYQPSNSDTFQVGAKVTANDLNAEWWVRADCVAQT